MAQKILVIEDDSVTLSLISILLKSANYDVAEANNGKEGLETLLESDFDLVLCDIEMPEIDGYTVLKSARKSGFKKPFIFLSGRDKREDHQGGMNLGADDYLTKPVVPDELFKCVESRLSSTTYIMAQKAQDLDQFKSFLSRALPHEFRTPLGLISGYADILSSYELDAEQQKDIGNMIKGASKRLTRITENYLLLSLNEKSIAKQYERETDLDLDVAEGVLNCTSRALEKIVMELVDNAFKFSSSGDRVLVSGRIIESAYELMVQDEGCGMTQQQLTSLSSFTQHDRDLHEQQGLGLGIEVVRSLTQSAEGSLDFTRLESGMEVKVSLPLKSTN